MKLLESIRESGIDRRAFVGLAAAAGATISLGLTGCSNKMGEVDEKSPTVDELDPLTGGEWVPILCTSLRCYRRCYNRAYVVDGVMVRQGSDNRHPDDDDNPQFRGCIKGRSLRHSITAADRLKYPMKRKGWMPGGGENVNGHLRGIDEWERISWDEATEYIAQELTRIKDTYGNRAFLATGGTGDRSIGDNSTKSPILNLLGGCLACLNTAVSQGGMPIVGNLTRGGFSAGIADGQDRIAMRNTKLIVYFGLNPAWSAPAAMREYEVNKRIAGTKVIIIDPYFSPTVQSIADQWIPIRPGTDGALLEALAYEMISNNLQDQDFLDKCTVGFDAEHMPEDAKTNENFKDYILGAYDGIPKTPEWASGICGIDPKIISDLAKEMATTKPAAIKTTGGPARTTYGDRFTQLLYAVGYMTGNVGVLGGEVTAGSAFVFGCKNAQKYADFGPSGYQWPTNPLGDGNSLQGGVFNPDAEYGIPKSEIYKAIVTGEYTKPGGEKQPCDIKCIYRDGTGSLATQTTGSYWMPEAHRKVDFVMVQDLFFTTDAQYADIVLPIQSTLEADFTKFSGSSAAPPELMLVGRKAIEPYFEAKSDAEAYFAVADKLGIDESKFPRMNDREAVLNNMAAATVFEEDGVTQVPLLTITQEDLDVLEFDGKTQDGKIGIQEFIEIGAYQVDRHEGDNFVNTYHKDFVADPVANPIKTTSGKYEIYCQKLKDYYDEYLFSDIDALPKYKPMEDGYEQALADPKFNLQLLSLHHIRQTHSTQASCAFSQELFANDLLMSEYDAKKLGFKTGDWVTASVKEGGKVARRLNVVPNLVPGTVILGQGNWIDVDKETGIDVGANVSFITRSQVIGDGYEAMNTILVAVEPYLGPPLLPDYLRPRKNPLTA